MTMNDENSLLLHVMRVDAHCEKLVMAMLQRMRCGTLVPKREKTSPAFALTPAATPFAEFLASSQLAAGEAANVGAAWQYRQCCHVIVKKNTSADFIFDLIIEVIIFAANK